MPRATRRKVLAPVDENVVGKDTSTADVLKLIESIETQGRNYFYMISWVYVVVVEIFVGIGIVQRHSRLVHVFSGDDAVFVQ